MPEATKDVAGPDLVKRNALSRMLFLFVAIVGGIAFYYFVLIEQGTEHVSRRNFRALAQIETQISGGFERILAVVELHKPKKDLATTDVAGHRYTVAKNAGTHCPSQPTGLFGHTNPGSQPLCFRATSRGDNTLFDLDIQLTDAKTGEKTNLVVKDVLLSHFLDFSSGQEQFQQVLIFDADRRLALRSSSDHDFDGNLDSYDQISNSTTTHESLVELPKSWNRSEGADKADKKAGGENNEERSLLVTKTQEFTIGKQEYLAFIRPFRLPYSEAGQAGRPEVWYAVGLTTKATFNASRFMLPRWWTAIMVLGLLMLALTLPYIKLKLLGPHDLITTWTIIWAVLGLTVAMVIGTTMLFNLCSHHATEKKMVQGIKDMSGALAERLNEEYRARKIELNEALRDFPRGGRQNMPAFKSISIFQGDGNIYATTPVADATFDEYSIADRQYWKALHHNRDLPEDGSDLTFYQETVESKVDGLKTTVLAMRRKSPLPDESQVMKACPLYWKFFSAPPKQSADSDPEDSFHIIAGSYRYRTLDKTILPKGFGFIVVDNASGIVQYHSEEHANMIERLYEETDNNPELKAAINAHQQRTFGTHYRGQQFFFSTHPLEYSNWTLITYFNRELLDRVNLGLLLTATGLSLGYLTIVVAGLVLAFRILSQTQINHLWPNPHQGRAYVRLSVLLAILALVEAFAIYALHAKELLIVLLASPVLALSGAYLCLVRRYRQFGWPIPFFVMRPCRWQWRRSLLQIAAAGSTLALLYSFVAMLKYTSLTYASLLLIAPRAILSLIFTPVLAWWLVNWLVETLQIDHESCPATDRRANRDKALVLHRCCMTLLITVGALLPTMAFFRDTTALNVLRWLQEDARKIRHQLERMATDPASDNKNLPYQERLDKLIADSGTLFPLPDLPCGKELEKNFIYAPATEPFVEELKKNSPYLAAVDTIMWPVIQVSAANSLPLDWFKLATNSNENIAEVEWLRCIQLHKKELVSNLPLQHRDAIGAADSPALKIVQRWHYSEIGLLDWPLLWLGFGGIVAFVIHPMVRLVLRELASESDLRPHPNLTRTGLELLCDDWNGVVLLINPSSLRRNTPEREYWTLEMLETDIAAKLSNAFPNFTVRRLGAAMRQPESELPNALIVAEYNWAALFAESAARHIELPQFEHAISWKKFLIALNKLRLPDDFPGLALNQWLPPRHFTLLACHSIEAQRTLLDFVAQRNLQAGPVRPENRWQFLQPGDNASIHNKIWISHLEKILHRPAQRRSLLDFLENARQRPRPPAIVLTGLILPHQWVTDPSLWAEQPPNALERARWLKLLVNVDIRSVESLNYEHDLEERTRARHALPRASREAEYELWWEYSTPAERIAMASLAHEGLINPLNQVVIRSLLARGLIFRLRKLRFRDHSFRQFVRNRLPATELHRHADLALQSSSWGAARGPLLITLAALGYAVMAMGGGTVETVLALVTSIGASIPALLNLTRLLRNNGGS